MGFWKDFCKAFSEETTPCDRYEKHITAPTVEEFTSKIEALKSEGWWTIDEMQVAGNKSGFVYYQTMKIRKTEDGRVIHELG
jgi:hypothetical protein